MGIKRVLGLVVYIGAVIGAGFASGQKSGILLQASRWGICSIFIIAVALLSWHLFSLLCKKII